MKQPNEFLQQLTAKDWKVLAEDVLGLSLLLPIKTELDFEWLDGWVRAVFYTNACIPHPGRVKPYWKKVFWKFRDFDAPFDMDLQTTEEDKALIAERYYTFMYKKFGDAYAIAYFKHTCGIKEEEKQNET